MEDEELIITEENFDQYFFDVRKYGWERDQVMARYRAKAKFVDTPHKRNMIDLLKLDKAIPAVQLMNKFHGATRRCAIEILIEMCKDMLGGMTDDEIAAKPYDMTIEYFFYTKMEHIPRDNPHWDCISVRDMAEELDSDLTVSARFVDIDGNEIKPEDLPELPDDSES